MLYQAIPVAELDVIRAAGRDEAGNPLEVQVHRDGGAPLRCCLREARGRPGTPAQRRLWLL